MHIDTSEPWSHMSTPETQADQDIRQWFEDAREQAYEASREIEKARDAWERWREEFRANMEAGAPDDRDDD